MSSVAMCLGNIKSSPFLGVLLNSMPPSVSVPVIPSVWLASKINPSLISFSRNSAFYANEAGSITLLCVQPGSAWRCRHRETVIQCYAAWHQSVSSKQLKVKRKRKKQGSKMPWWLTDPFLGTAWCVSSAHGRQAPVHWAQTTFQWHWHTPALSR